MKFNSLSSMSNNYIVLRIIQFIRHTQMMQVKVKMKEFFDKRIYNRNYNFNTSRA